MSSLGKTQPSEWLGVHVADARSIANLLPAEPCIDTTITSPPYGGTIDYGLKGQIGFGQSHADYLGDMKSIFGVLYDRTRATGSLWLVADSFKKPTKSGVSRLVPLPFELAALAEEAGWILHDVIIWVKDRTLPWSRRGQLRNSFEYVLFFVKTAKFKYHLERVRTDQDLKDWWLRYPERYSPLGAAPTNVWTYPIPPQGSWTNGHSDHRCPLPQGLVRRMLELTTDEGDVVCDPFSGAGTVPAVALAEGRLAFGTELSNRHVEQFYSAFLPEVLATSASGMARPAATRYGPTIAALRHGKFPRMLARRLLAAGVPLRAATINTRVVVPSADSRFSVGSQAIDLFVEAGSTLSEVEDVARLMVARPPLSKFGIEATLVAHSIADWTSPAAVGSWTKLQLGSGDPVDVSGMPQPLPVDGGLLIIIDLPSGSLLPRLQVPEEVATNSL
jgi:DNA modification methylase